MNTAELENDDTLEAIEINTEANDASDDETNAVSDDEGDRPDGPGVLGRDYEADHRP